MSKIKLFFLAIGLLILSVIGMSFDTDTAPAKHHTATRNSAKDVQGMKAAGAAYESYLEGGN